MSVKGKSCLQAAFTLLAVLVFTLPLWWMFAASLRPTGLPPSKTVEWWPSNPQWSSYAEVFRQVPMGRYTINSIMVVSVAVPLSLFTSAIAGFGLSQLRSPWRSRLLIAAIALMMVPSPAVWLFRYQLLSWLGLLTSIWSLVLPAFAAGSPLLVLLFYWTFRRIPVELFEAARVEGADAWTTWLKIAMPMARPTTAAVTVLAFALFWNDFTNPVLYLFKPSTYTMPVGLQILKQLDATNWPLLMAGSVIVALPMVLLFLLLQPLFLSDNALSDLLDRG
jgi:multiple sugar transport system permease protein